MTADEFKSVAEQESGAIYSFCRRICGSKGEADDLYQEAFLKAAERMDKIDAGSNPKSFIISLAVGLWRNKCRKSFLRQKIAPQTVFDGSEENTIPVSEMTEDIILRRERQREVQKAANQLPDRYRIPLYLYYTAQLSIEETADVLSIPEGTVKSRLHKARLKMKERLEGVI